MVVPGDPEANGGLGNHMWAVVVDRAGVIWTVTRSGETFGDQWPSSRSIAGEKAFTANAFSLPGFALSTANLYWPTQPENSLYALATSNPVHKEAFYFGNATSWGTEDDPVVGRRTGGTVVFAGGLALYDAQGELVGGLGVSGDESCTDHIVAWKVRPASNLDNVPAGVTKAKRQHRSRSERRPGGQAPAERERLRSPDLQSEDNHARRKSERDPADRARGVNLRSTSSGPPSASVWRITSNGSPRAGRDDHGAAGGTAPRRLRQRPLWLAGIVERACR